MRSKAARILLGVAALLAVVALGCVLWLWRTLHALDRPDVQAALLARLSQAAGVEVKARAMEVSIFSGLRLEGVTVRNPAPFTGQLLGAEAIVLRHRLLPLLGGRLEMDALSITKPAVHLVLDARGTSNLERLLAARPGQEAAAPAGVLPLRLVVRRGTVSGATLDLRDQRGRMIAVAEDVDLTSAFEVGALSAHGEGRASIGRATVGSTTVERIESDLALSKELVHLANIRGRIAGGTLKGEVKLHVPQSSYEGAVEVEDARVETLLGAAAPIAGRLRARADLQGAGVAGMRGRGRAQVADCRAQRSPLLAAVATVLALPELARPELSRCEVEFTMAGPRVTTSPLLLKGEAFELTGRGTTNLDTRGIDHDLTLALPRAALARLPVAETRAAFKDRGDGLSTIDFKATGTIEAPRTDLPARVARATAVEGVRKGLRRLWPF
jgi:hypothetical protein